MKDLLQHPKQCGPYGMEVKNGEVSVKKDRYLSKTGTHFPLNLFDGRKENPPFPTLVLMVFSGDDSVFL